MRGAIYDLVCVRFSPDGKRVGCCGGQSPPAVFDAQIGERLFDLEGQDGKVRRMAFSGDGKRIVTAGDDTTVRIWDAKSGQALSTLAREKFSAFSTSFSPDGERLIVGGYHVQAQIWRLRRPEQWWGIAWLPEFWIAVVCGLSAFWSFTRDCRKLKAIRENKAAVSICTTISTCLWMEIRTINLPVGDKSEAKQMRRVYFAQGSRGVSAPTRRAAKLLITSYGNPWTFTVFECLLR